MGERIDLTIDERLQKMAYELLGEESGGVVLIDVHTGEILALASTLSYHRQSYRPKQQSQRQNFLHESILYYFKKFDNSERFDG